MARKEYLTPEERTRFDNPPQLLSEQKGLFLQIPEWASAYLKTLQTPTTQVGFLLQLGYFRVVSRFFLSNRFIQADINYIVSGIMVDPNQIDFTDYFRTTYFRHQEEILKQLGYTGYDKDASQLISQEMKRLVSLRTEPVLIMESVITFLDGHRIEIPPYATLRALLEKSFRQFEQDLEAIMVQYLQQEDKNLLDSLLVQHDSYQQEEKKHVKVQRYQLTFFKRITQSMQPSVIKGRIDNFVRLKEMYFQLLPIITRLNLPEETIKFYAEYVIDNQIFQVADRDNTRYLLLVSFIIHQYYQLGDALVLTFNQAVTSAVNDCENKIKESLFENRMNTSRLVSSVSIRSVTHIDVLSEVERIIHDQVMEASQKVELIDELLRKRKVSSQVLLEDQQRLNNLKLVNQRISDREDYYQALEKGSLRLQIRVSDLIKVLAFDFETSQKQLLDAIDYFQMKDGNIQQHNSVPIDFLSLEEKQRVITPDGKIRISLYKVLLFREMRDHIRAGALNVRSSYLYRSFEEYMITKLQWVKDKDFLLKRASLSHLQKPAPILLKLNEELNFQFRLVNQHIGNGQNQQVYVDAEGQWHMHRYKPDENEIEDPQNLYPQTRAVSLLEVLTTIDQISGFNTAFQHKGIDYLPPRPAEKLFFATIIGLGCNIGIPKMSMISKNIAANALQTTSVQYFSPDMTLKANDLVVEFSNKLPLTDKFRIHPGFIHTSSDGQKYDVSVASLRAAWSFKYFGNGKGVTVYSHLDEAGQLFYSTAFSSSDHEAPYMIDGLMHNRVIQSDAHSTDTGGFSEIIFAITALLGIAFRPRLAKIHEHNLFSIDSVTTYRDFGYQVKPDSKINFELIIEHWDEILRFITTIKLGYSKASTLIRRLNSYSRQHPLYKALKELGRIYKTLYILQYMDQPAVRKSVERVLSKIENSNKFAKAISHGNNQQLIGATYREQLTAEGCKRLIANSINCWNLLHLSGSLAECKKPADREVLLKNILATSTHSWEHINMLGEYDFSEKVDFQAFNLDEIFKDGAEI
jgi:TnpA family transposase